jgi:uncharacterized protein (DUF1800 family)
MKPFRVIGSSLFYALVIHLTFLTPASAQITDRFFASGFEQLGPANRTEAARFLNQASFGATDASIDRVMQVGYEAWIDEQFALPATLLKPRLAYLRTIDNEYFLYDRQLHYASWYWAAVNAPDQLRQRSAWALSQIFVASMENATVRFHYDTMIAYYDVLIRGANGRYRDLLQNMTLTPAMGMYLSHFANTKDNPATGARPDENYAREIMQLFSIGLWQLNPDGTRILVNGQPVPTYTNADVEGLAKVFTGWSWGDMRPDWQNNEYGFYSSVWGHQNNNAWYTPMASYPVYHSTSEKRFLGLTIAPQASANPQASLTTALDGIALHPNVGPFMARRLIQHFVTSNPSPGYVGRVAAVFNSTSTSTRGDLAKVIKAVLLDSEARNPPALNALSYGKLREPVLRLTQAARSLNFRSVTDGRWLVTTTQVYFAPFDPPGTIGQLPMHAPSVFSYFRATYVPPNSELSRNSLIGPEFQIQSEVSAADWVNSIDVLVNTGMAQTWYVNPFEYEIKSNFTAEAALANTPDALIDRLAMLLVGGPISIALRDDLRAAINVYPTSESGYRLKRVRIAVTLLMASPEYLIQK